MGIITSLVIGAVIGGLITWQYDQRKQHQDKAKRDHQLVQAQAEIRRLKAQQAEAEDLAAEETPSEDNVETESPLQQIRGIGKVFAARLNEAGILTFADLAALPPEQVQEIVSVETGHMADVQAWIIQARQFARESQKNGE